MCLPHNVISLCLFTFTNIWCVKPCLGQRKLNFLIFLCQSTWHLCIMLFWSSNTLRIESKNALHYWALDCCVLRNRFTILSPVQPLTKNPFVHYASSGYHSTMNMISTKYINQTNVMKLSFFSSTWSLLRKSVAKDHGGSEICFQVHTHKVLNTRGNWNWY